ncbi:MAG: beta-propeller domain-containing protein [Verrucomicrobiota bacterium]
MNYQTAQTSTKADSSSRFWIGALIAALFAQGSGSSAASSNNISLGIQTSPQSITVGIPAGCTNCLVEVRLKGKKQWLRWRTFSLNGKPTSVSLTPPKDPIIAEWRASGSINSQRAKAFAKQQKFPEAFYQGTRQFAKTPAFGYQATAASAQTALTRNTVETVTPLATATAGAKTNDTAATTTTVEADIWKTDGSTVYFFNQLRGLQVLDLSDPAAPKLNATFRMPAIGQDLYLLPEQTPGERLLVLLTRDYRSGSSETDVVVVKVAGKTATEISRSSIKGWLADSRMAGNKLYTVTTDWNVAWAASTKDTSESNTTLTETVIQADGTQTTQSNQTIAGLSSNALISSGNDWIAVTTSNWSSWNKSSITLFQLSQAGATRLTPTPVSVNGSVYDKFKVSYDSQVLSAVSVRYENATWNWTPISTLENFDVSGNKLGSLEIIRGEQLFATRFTSGKLYAVTFKRIDPLWVIDLADQSAPKIKGHVEVPGFSTYIEPMGEKGEFLFTIGQDTGKVAASLFDVSDLANPTLKSRVLVDETNWGYSEATYDEKALKVLPDDGLALIPFTGFRFPLQSTLKTNTSTTEKASFVRLVDINLANGGSLTVRGRLDHDFAPRRATLVNGILTSISQKELITANIDNRDKPSVLADVLLAWPVNQVVQSGEYVLQISDGSSAVWSGERAAIRISKNASDSTILTDVELGDGTVQEAVLKSNKLYVLRKNWNTNYWFYARPLGAASTTTDKSELVLDVYDTAALPNLPLLGSASIKLDSSETDCIISNLVWITETIPAVVTQNRPWSYWGGPVMTLTAASATAKVATSLVAEPIPYRRQEITPAIVRAFDIGTPTAPVALASKKLENTTETMVSTVGAGEGLLIFGYGEKLTPYQQRLSNDYNDALSCIHRLGVLDFSNPAAPIQRTPVTIPGRLFAVGEVSRSGFLAYTESLTDAAGTDGRQVQVSLIDELAASLVVSTPVGNDARLAAEGRNLYVAEESGISRLTLTDSATLTKSATAKTEWNPNELMVRGSSLLGTNGDRLMRVSWPGIEGVVETWQIRQWFQLSKLATGLDQTIYAPVGDYGMERFGVK